LGAVQALLERFRNKAAELFGKGLWLSCCTDGAAG
jgi:hypothetical protein